MKMMNRILEKTTLLSSFLDEDKLREYKEFLSNLKVEKLYHSKIHGEYHSEKVSLFAFILANEYHLDEVDKQIIIDAALYHDIGRMNDLNECFHGLASANRIEYVVDSPIYKNEDNLNLLKAICEAHSCDDSKDESTFSYNCDWSNVNDEKVEALRKRFKMLNAILKDSDALDRNRFADGYNFGLNEKYLRLDGSKKLVELSRELNEIYNDLTTKEVDLDNVDKTVGTCYHGIGCDFFKISSILENGILSLRELRMRGIKGVRNFDGGNARDWISVVDPKAVTPESTGYKNFTSNSVNFVCENQVLVKPLPNNQRSKSYETGLPYDKSGHIDERYVYKKIDRESIKEIMIIDTFANKKIDDLYFLFDCLDHRNFLSRVFYFIENTNAEEIGYEEDKMSLINLLSAHKLNVEKYEEAKFKNNRDFNMDELYIELGIITNSINLIIRKLMKKYYTVMMKQDGNELTVKDIVSYELSKSGKEYDMIQDCGCIKFVPKVKEYHF